MRVVTAPWGWYPDDINSRLDFDQFATSSPDAVLFVGISCTEEMSIIQLARSFKRSVYINLEHPCTLYSLRNKAGLDAIQQQTIFNEVYTICPYSAEWLNGMNLGTKFVAMPYPHNLKYDTYQQTEKQYDVAYCGLIHSEEIASYIEAIKECDYFFSTLQSHNRVSTVNYLATHNNIPNIEKWQILSKARTAIIQNNLYLTPPQVEIIKALPGWDKNEAFSHIDVGLLPQLKSRTVESALCKSLMLVKRDPWNVIERWFTEGEDFVYFENDKDLQDKVKEINTNWSRYEPLVDSAYKKVINRYNTQHIFEQIKEGKEI